MKQNMVFLAGVVCILLASCNNIFYTLASSGTELDTGEYIVRFDKNGGDTEANPQTIIVKAPGSTVMLPPIEPGRNGYIFTAWNTNADGSGAEFTKDTLVKANITVYAQWLYLPPGSFIVHFDKNNTDANSQEAYPQNKAVIPPSDTINGELPAKPTRTGYDFTGWNTASDGTGTVFDEGTTVTENITVYAQWEPYKCIITFDKNHNDDGGFKDADPRTITVAYPATSAGVLPAPPERDHYDFTGWNTKADGTGEEFTAGTPVGIILENKTLTVYAQWAEKTYTISGTIYRSDGEGADGAFVTLYRGGVEVDTTRADANGAYMFTGVLARDNYTIRATLDRHIPDTTPPFDVDWEDVSGKDLTLIRMWVISGTVREAETNDPLSGAQVKLMQDSTLMESTDTLGNGYYELYALTGTYSITVSYLSYVTETESVDVSSDIENKDFSLRLITFAVSGTVTLLDGGSGNVQNVNLRLERNDGIYYETNPLANNSYNFPAVKMGDYTIYASLSGYEGDYDWFNVTDADVSNINLTLKKQWTVSFDSTGGDFVSSQTVAHNDTAYRPSDPYRLSFNFINWYSDSSLTTVYTFTTPVTSDITLYAKWEEVPTYTVSFISNGGSSVSSQTVNSGSTASRPANPTKSGNAFDNWYSDSSLTTIYNFSTPVTGNITLYAKWNPIYTVTFNSNGGSSVSSQTVISGSTATRPANPTKSGNTFDNWYSDPGLNNVYNFSTPVTSDITLYAKWNLIVQWTVTFDSNGGSSVSSQTVNSGSTASRPSNPTKSDNTFDNWYSDPGLTNVYNFSTPVTSDITLYAKWNEISIPPTSTTASGTVTLVGGNGNVQNVQVQLFRLNAFTQQLEPVGSPVNPNASGYYTVSGVTEGALYIITASLDGYVIDAKSVLTATVNLTLYLETT